MKIIREHRGFTTNSSSSSEFIGPPPAEGEGLHAEVFSEPPPSPLVDNLTMIGGFVLALIGIFALERLIRRWIKRVRSTGE